MRRPALSPCLRFSIGAALFALSLPAFAADANHLADLSVEQLLNLKVTSVARREETVSHSPAAIYVITHEDIRRSGTRSIPDALRLAPGLDVAQVDAHTWAVSSRGFNSVFANKLLVLIDGRSVYTPLFSGVFWDAQDVLIEDIDRIEIIRGPGAALWGANAVNGVINITTKRVADLRGAHVVFIGASETDRPAANCANLAESGTLCVGDTDATAPFTAINFGRIVFSVNLAAVKRSNIAISSKLLHLAKSVTGAPVGERIYR